MAFRSIVQRSAVMAAVVLSAAALGTPGAHANGLPSIHRTKVAPTVTASKLFKKPYTRNWKWVSHDLRVCVKFTATGHFTYRTHEHFTTHAAQEIWTNQTIHDPTLKVAFYKVNCRTRLSISSVSIEQHWTGYGCSFNPHISVSVSVTGLSVAVSAWPSCGDRTQALYSTGYGRGQHHTQFNSGSPIGFGDYTDPITGVGLLNPPPCYGVFPSAVIHFRGNSDSFGAGNIKHAQKVCLPPNG